MGKKEAKIETREGQGIRAVADPEVPEKAVRRRFTAEYKRQILKEVDVCKEPGQIGRLLPREGRRQPSR